MVLLLRSWGLAFGSSPPLWRPQFAIILQEDQWEAIDENPRLELRNHPNRRGGVKEGQALFPP